jgi:hypothetical protein
MSAPLTYILFACVAISCAIMTGWLVYRRCAGWSTHSRVVSAIAPALILLVLWGCAYRILLGPDFEWNQARMAPPFRSAIRLSTVLFT